MLGSAHVYFQPPASVKMVYPAIVYNKTGLDSKFADNAPYNSTWEYEVLVIDRDPDSVVPDKVAKLPMCTFSNSFVADNLNHYAFRLFF